MSTRPANQRALQHDHAAPLKRCPTPGELLFEFYRERDHSRWRCELRDHGPYGIEAQFFQNEELFYGRRFDARLDPTRSPRELATAWATAERKGIEADPCAPPSA